MDVMPCALLQQNRLSPRISKPAWLWRRQERLDQFPQLIIQHRFRHDCTSLCIHDFGYFDTIRTVFLLRALSYFKK